LSQIFNIGPEAILFTTSPRRAIPPDLSAVARLYHAVWHETHAPLMPAEEAARRTVAFFTERMSALLPSTMLVETDGSLAGFASWSGDLLGQIYVAAPYRGSGLAAMLLTAAENAMASEGTDEAELHCIRGNERARCFYERMGWRHDCEVMETVAGPAGDCDIAFWRMRKRLE
jgi:GNAT superfamily N-acetyltransferase